MVGGVEIEIAEAVGGALAHRLDLPFGRLAFDFDELVEFGDGVQCDGVAVEAVPLALFLDHGGGGEAEGFEDVVESVAVLDPRLDLSPGLRVLLDQRPLVGYPRRRLAVTRLPADAERLVGLGEIAVWSVVVGVDLCDDSGALGTEFVETVPDRVVARSNLQFDFVHALVVGVGRQKPPGDGNVILKGRTGVVDCMSDEQAESADEPVDADTADDPDAEPETETETETEEVAGLQEDDFVRLDYTVRTADDGTVVDTTDEAVAEEAGIDEEGHEFGPRTVVIGAGHVFEAVNDDLIGREVGDGNTVHIDAVDAFGEFDPDEVRTVSAEKIDEDDRYPGAHVNVDGQQGHIETIIGGRARVDFNHPLAGEDLEYEYEVVEVVDDRETQAQGLLGMHLEHEPEVWIQTDEVEEEVQVEVESDDEDNDGEPAYETELQTVEKETLYIEATPPMTMNQQWLFQKQQIAQQIMDRLDLDRVIVQETIDGMGGMMGGMGGMMGGMGGAGGADVEEALEDVDVDADEIVDELEEDLE